jgi:hypothetical protein
VRKRAGYMRMSHTPTGRTLFGDMERAESTTGARHQGRYDGQEDVDGGEIRFDPTPPADYTDEAAKARYSELYVKAYDVAVLEEDWTPEDVDNFPVGSRIRYLVEGAA